MKETALPLLNGAAVISLENNIINRVISDNAELLIHTLSENDAHYPNLIIQ